MAKAYNGELPKIQLVYKGTFDFKHIYELMRDFLIENGFVDIDFPQSGGKPDMFESRYLEKGSPITGYWIDWKTQKIIEKNTYYRYTMDVQFQGVAISKVDVMELGQKVSRQKGELNIYIDAKIETDYKKEWTNHWFLKNFRHQYDKVIMKKEFQEMHEDSLYSYMYRFQAIIKRYFKLMGGETYPEKTSILKQ
jgi:hypothetical protein